MAGGKVMIIGAGIGLIWAAVVIPVFGWVSILVMVPLAFVAGRAANREARRRGL